MCEDGSGVEEARGHEAKRKISRREFENRRHHHDMKYFAGKARNYLASALLAG